MTPSVSTTVGTDVAGVGGRCGIVAVHRPPSAVVGVVRRSGSGAVDRYAGVAHRLDAVADGSEGVESVDWLNAVGRHPLARQRDGEEGGVGPVEVVEETEGNQILTAPTLPLSADHTVVAPPLLETRSCDLR